MRSETPKSSRHRPFQLGWRNLTAFLFALAALAGCGGEGAIEPVESQENVRLSKPARAALDLAMRQLDEMGVWQRGDFVTLFCQVADLENDGIQSLGDAA
ncbi:MAG: hypothetical protein KDM64_19010, partial [Verrucomicrobiae bacterium]|nr:hypothetical protein [Verrucomicrobiae bacterium]